MAPWVLREEGEGLPPLTLNGPERLNALSPRLFAGLDGRLRSIADDSQVGCVILRGAGRAFSAGADVRAIQAGERGTSQPHEVLIFMELLRQPIIASVHGYCYTAALELMLACDLAVAAASARFADTHARFGLAPIWGMSQRLPRRIGTLRAKEMLFAGRPVTGPEAAAIGLVNQSVPDDELEAATLTLARAIVENSWHSLAYEKRLLNEGQNYTLAEGLAFEHRSWTGRLPDTAERLQRFSRRDRA